MLEVLEETPKWKGLFIWQYNIIEGKLYPTTVGIVSSVDNANLVFALIGVAGAYLDATTPEKKPLLLVLKQFSKSR